MTWQTADPFGADLREVAVERGTPVERVTADQLESGDVFAAAQTHPPMTLEAIESVGASSRYLKTERGGRIRPRHTTKFWRLRREES